MIRSEFHSRERILELLLPFLESDVSKYRPAIKQLKGVEGSYDISMRHRGFCSIPIEEKYVSKESWTVNNLFVTNRQGRTKEIIVYLSGGAISGFEAKDDLENLDIETFDFSQGEERGISFSPYYKDSVDIEGEFDEIPELYDYVDASFESEQYEINGEEYFRIISFDNHRCLGIDNRQQVLKINLKNGSVQLLFRNYEEFLKALKKDKDYVFRLYGVV